MQQGSLRSTFVTVVAWVFIVLSGLGSLIAIFQNVMVATVFKSGDMMLPASAAPSGTPDIEYFMFSHFQLIFMAFLCLSLIMLAASIGLLKRMNWARLVFIALLGLAIVWQLAGIVVQITTFDAMQAQLAHTHSEPFMHTFLIAAAVLSIIFGLAMSILFGWIAKRLLSPQVRLEFGH